MSEVDIFSIFEIAFCQFIYAFDCRLIYDSRLFKINNNFIWIIFYIKLTIEKIYEVNVLEDPDYFVAIDNFRQAQNALADK